MPTMQLMNQYKSINIITGGSGSGKSTAIAAFEDAGFYCVDNMPVSLLPEFLNLQVETPDEISGFAFVMDLRETGLLQKYGSVFEDLKTKGYAVKIIYLEASEKCLITRYSKTRRHHPMARKNSLSKGIQLEKKLLVPLRNEADTIIDTTDMSVHELKLTVLNIAGESANLKRMSIVIHSFGFKYGPPDGADLVVDVRFLNNPHFVPELKPFSGENQKIIDFVLNNDKACLFLRKYLDLLDYLIPQYEKEGKAYLTIAVGCTGGRHRSVAVAGALYQHLAKAKSKVRIIHRDLDKGSS